MKKYSILLLSCIVILLSACKKYEPLHEGEWKDSNLTPPAPVVPPVVRVAQPRTIAMIISNDVYMMDIEGRFLKKITNSSTVSKTKVMISPQYDKIAYLHDGQIRVIDTIGTVIAYNVGWASTFRYFNWHSNNTLLYGLNEGTRRVEALQGTLPAGLPQPVFSPNYNPTVYAAYITAENDLLYARTNTNFANTRYYSIAYAKNGSSAAPQSIPISEDLFDIRCNKAGTLAYIDAEYRISIKNRAISMVRTPTANTLAICPLNDTTTYLSSYYNFNSIDNSALFKVKTTPTPANTKIFDAGSRIAVLFDTK
jgi:hypothetical protein